MYGDRGRIGLVVPSTNTSAEPETGRLLPQGVVAYATRILQREAAEPAGEVAALLAVRTGFGRAVDELASFRPAAIGIAATAAGFLNGAVDDRETCSVLSVRAGCPVLTGSRAAVLALRALGAGRVALATPDRAALTGAEVRYLAEEDVRVLGTAGPGVVGELAKGRLGADAVTAAVLAAYRPGMDAVLVTGCTWPTVEGRAELERRTGVPVVSSTTAITWALLRRAGVTGALPDLGHLGTV